MPRIQSKPVSKEFRENFDRVFESDKEEVFDVEDTMCQAEKYIDNIHHVCNLSEHSSEHPHHWMISGE